MESGFNVADATGLLNFQIERNFTVVAKSILTLLEDLEEGQNITYDRQRKKVLDAVNDAKREIQGQLGCFEIKYKHQ